MPPEADWIVVVADAVVDPTVVVLSPAPDPIEIDSARASVDSDTGPPLAVMPANVKVSVEPDPPKDNPVLPPEKIKADPTNGPPVSPIMVISSPDILQQS